MTAEHDDHGKNLPNWVMAWSWIIGSLGACVAFVLQHWVWVAVFSAVILVGSIAGFVLRAVAAHHAAGSTAAAK